MVAPGLATAMGDAGVGAAAAGTTDAVPCFAAAGAPAAEAFASESILAMTSPETTVPPSDFTISVITPADGAGTSSTTLSVSISIRISSITTASPGFFFHCNKVASATDSDNWGTFTS